MPNLLDGEEITLRNPDGTTFRARGWGDQDHAVFETEAGYTVVRDGRSGFWRYAVATGDGHHLEATALTVGRDDPRAAGLALHARMSREAARAAVTRLRADEGPSRWQVRSAALAAATAPVAGAADRAPYPFGSTKGHVVGTYVGLCILIDFPDTEGEFSTAEVDDLCNEIGYSRFGNNGSVRDYFHDVSDGKLVYTNLVTRYYTARNRKEYYTDESIPKRQRARELITESLNWLVEHDFDFSPLSADEDGYVYALNVFYAGEVMNSWSEGLWPHSSHLDEAFELADGRKFYDYQVTPMGSELVIGRFCHENGHLLCSFPDLYDRDPPPDKSSGAGHFSLMASGDLADMKNPVEVDAYLKNRAGWTTRITPMKPGMKITLTAGRNEFAILARTLDEFFIVENRQQAGRDAAIDDSGLAIWHVDRQGNNNNEAMTAESHYLLSLEQADGAFDLEAGENRGDGGDLFADVAGVGFSDTTTPDSRWWNGARSGLSIEQISVSGPKMTFVVSGGPAAPALSFGQLLLDRRPGIPQITALLLG